MLIRKLATVTFAVVISLAAMAWATGQQQVQQHDEPQGDDGAGQADIIVVDKCKIEWKDQRIIASKIPGIIERIYVTEGDIVKPGMLLAKLDDREKAVEYSIQQAIAESTLAIEIAEARAEEYKAELDTAIRLFKSRAMSEEERRLAEVRWKINKLEAEREKENHRVEQLKAQHLKIQLDDHRIVSPMKGIVQKVYKRERETLSIAGGLDLFRIVDPDVVWVEGDVPIKYLYRVRRGLQVEVQPQYFDTDRKRVDLPQGKMKFRGRVTFVDPEVQPVNKTFLVRAEVINTGHVLRQGLSAIMSIVLGPAEQKEPRRVAQRRSADPLRPSASGFDIVGE